MTRQRRFPRVTVLLSAAAVAAALFGACDETASQPPRRVLRLTTGTPGARFYPLGQALASSYAAAFPGFEVRAQDSDGSVSNVDALQRGEADVGLAYADVAYMAYVGRLGDQPRPFTDVRGMAVLELAPVHLVVGANAAITGLSGLRGRRVAVGPAGSGSALTAQLVLRALGIDADVRVESLRYNDAARRLVSGTVDALFVTGTDPVDAVRTSTEGGARLLPLSGVAIDKLRHDYPFFRRTVVPGGTYPGHPNAVHTIGVDNLLVCRRGLDESTAHDLTRAFFLALPTLPMPEGTDLEQAPATPIPLHDGAARYYRERELAR